MTDDERLLDYLKRITIDLHDTRVRLRESEERSRVPVAIVGMSCRYPGGVHSPQDLWDLVASGRDAISPFPTDRGWNLDALFDTDPNRPGTCYARTGGFVDSATDFDAEFFGISPREALAMDPQQRVLLEATWEALEHAGIDPLTLNGTKTGVFAGISSQTYGEGLRSVPEELEGHWMTGTLASVLSGRVAYTLGLEGPAVTVDTACSSSLVATHLACQALRLDECSLALAGGVTILATPNAFIGFSRQHGLAFDGRCKSFADQADGAGFSEGVGVLVLERLSDAQQNGHRVLGVVRGSAVNQDGASNGLTAPNGPSQQRVIAQALANAGLTARDVDVVEAHGTGTILGDPIEAQALLATYGQGRDDSGPLWLGSIKSNIGHAQAAAGVAGVIKMVMALEHELLPKTLNVDEPSRQVDWSEGCVSLLTEPQPWRPNGRPRRAGISSFGISGTNAHLVLEEEPESAPSPQAASRSAGDSRCERPVFSSSETVVVPWLVSGRGVKGLQAQANKLSEHAEGGAVNDIRDAAYSLAYCRAALDHRAVVIGADNDQILGRLRMLAEGRSALGLTQGVVSAGGASKIVFVFPGQGSQWKDMATDLLSSSPVFAEQIELCAKSLAPFVDWSLEEVLRHDGSDLERVDVVQPALFAVMVSLAALWRACGVHPDIVMGHSQGEIAAAYVAGGLSLQDAAQVITQRSRALAKLAGRGGMLSIVSSAKEIEPLLEPWGEHVAIAAVNGPSTVVVSGDLEAIKGLRESCEARDVRVREIAVDYAAHSSQVEEIRQELLDGCRGIAPRSGAVRLCSTVTGELLDAAEMGPDYWYRNLRETVRLTDATNAVLNADGAGFAFVEVSPHPVLTVGLQETVDQTCEEPEKVAITGSLRREEGGFERFFTSLAELWVHGYSVDWGGILRDAGAQQIALPTYAFQRERYWLESHTTAGNEVPANRAPENHPILSEVMFSLEWVPVVIAEPRPVEGVALLAEKSSQVAISLIDLECGIEVHHDLESLQRALDGGVSIPETVLVDCTGQAAHPGSGAVRETAHRMASRTLDLVQGWLADERISRSRLVFLTQRAVAVGENDDVDDLAASVIWGLVRSAQAENPGQFMLIDLDRYPRSADALGGMLHLEEPQLAIRSDGVFVPRLDHLTIPTGDEPASRVSSGEDLTAFDDLHTVLITGGTGALGRLVARHLVAEHGVRSVVLVSRSGLNAPGAAELRGELQGLGAQVSVVECDVSSREQLEEVLALVPEDFPLGAIVHAAGILDDGVLGSLTHERLEPVLCSKLDGAWLLHELTDQLDLQAFVVFSSATGVIGSIGQANYAAANAFLDALVAYRRSKGLVGSSIGWGFWASPSGMTGHLEEADLARMARHGVMPLSVEQSLKQLDLACTLDRTLTLPIRFDMTALRAQARRGGLPVLLQGLVRMPVRHPDLAEASLAQRLTEAPENQRERLTLDIVCAETAVVLGHDSSLAVEPRRTFKDLGLTSLTAVELRNKLNAATGLRLHTAVIFDHPTPIKLAGHLIAEIMGDKTVPMRVAYSAYVDEPLAIVGLSCRYPGGVRCAEDLWRLVTSGEDAISGFPSDRGWNFEEIFMSHTDRSETDYAREGGFIYDVGEFDAAFFGISPREASAMDPQQRLLLEASWECIEDAGIAPLSLTGTQAGVFVGISSRSYGPESSRSMPAGTDGYLVTGLSGSVASGRVAYTLGLEGPAVTVDTACSSSLVAMHLACQALRAGECSLALAGGVTVMASPHAFMEFSLQRALARDGRCKPFSDCADGTGFSEGVGVVLLERLSEAQANRHQVLAVVRASAVNQDGASNGLTAPNGLSQQRLITQTLANAGLSATDIDIVEAHGTGTTLGDPIEAHALLATYGQNRPSGRPLWLGSIKSNIGHAQAAAGVAGVIKMVMALQHEILPKSLHVDEQSKHVDWSAGDVAVLTQSIPWVGNGRPRRAAISSFGISGTNAHMIIEQAPEAADQGRRAVPRSFNTTVVSWPISGRGPSGLRAQAKRLLDHARSEAAQDIKDVGYSLASCRSAMDHRAVVVGDDREVILGRLRELGDGPCPPGMVQGAVIGERSRKIVFVFPGQGSQWPKMATELLCESPLFASQIKLCEAALAPLVDWSLEDVLRGDGSELERVDVVQPTLFAVMVSLSALWQDCGVYPDLVVGHSQGEIAAAHVAGGLSLQDAARVVACRSRALAKLAGHGGMLSVSLPIDEVESLLEPWRERAAIAAVNGPAAVVVSGDPETLDAVRKYCAAQGVRARTIAVDYAAHSAQVEEIREELLEGCRGITPHSSYIPLCSTVTGQLLDTAEMDAEYWYRNLREPVRFTDATLTSLREGCAAFVEISPHPVLTFGLQETIDDLTDLSEQTVVTGSLRRDEGGCERFFISLAELWVRGFDVEWPKILLDADAKQTRLPTYAFQRERYWLQHTEGAADLSSIGLISTEHPLLSSALCLAEDDSWLFTSSLSPQSHAWLSEHTVMGRVLLAGTAFLEMALCAGDYTGCKHIEELAIEAPLVLPEAGSVQLQVSVSGADSHGNRSVKIHSRIEDPQGEGPFEALRAWTLHASGTLCAHAAASVEHLSQQRYDALLSAGVWPPDGAVPVNIEHFYERLADAGFEYGIAFRGLRAAWRREHDVFAEVELSGEEDAQAGSFILHPALLDAAHHGLAVGVATEGSDGLLERRLPFAWRGVDVYRSGAKSARVVISLTALDHADTMSLMLVDEAGALVAGVASLALRPVSVDQLMRAASADAQLFTLSWCPHDAERAIVGTPRAWAWLGEGGEEIALCLERRGISAHKYSDVAALESDASAPVLALAYCRAGEPSSGPGTIAAQASACAGRTLGLVQEWLSSDRLEGSRLVLITRDALAVSQGDSVDGIAASTIWGLVRSVQAEHRGRFVLIDIDGDERSKRSLLEAIDIALSTEDVQLAIRAGKVMVPRMGSRTAAGMLEKPTESTEWRLDLDKSGTLDGFSLAACGKSSDPLGARHVRIEVRAAGLNFRDVLAALDMYPGDASIGGEGAGVVIEVGSEVDDIVVGDCVMGVFSGAFGSVAVSDHRLVVKMPGDWSFVQAASVPIAFLTAYYGLVDLAQLRRGERLLVHAAAGGVGMAAVQIARCLGAEVFGTASPEKWEKTGLTGTHIASSRTLEFAQRFLDETDQEGFDVVLNSLTGEFIDMSLKLLPRGGRFIEMGRADIRDATQIAASFPGVVYDAFELMSAGPERIREMLDELLKLFANRALQFLPIASWDIRRSPDAFRSFSQARHVGKNVVTVSEPFDPARTVLITGGPGTLGALVAKHLVTQRKIRSLLLASRRGLEAPGAIALRSELRTAGAQVEVIACDVSNRTHLQDALLTVPEEYPLGAVIHAAGVLDDGVVGALTDERLEAVLRPKIYGAWLLHELTERLGLDAFVVFSAAGATLGSPGQGNYAAANAFLDALMAYRRDRGLAGLSMAWGFWRPRSAMTGHLEEIDLARMARYGIVAMAPERCLELFDLACEMGEPHSLPVHLDFSTLRIQARDGALPPPLRNLVQAPARKRESEEVIPLRQRLQSVPGNQRRRLILEAICVETATILGHASPELIASQSTFKEMGFDSLTGVELRNRLNAITELRLASTVIFDHPTPAVLAAYLHTELYPSEQIADSNPAEMVVREALASVSLSRLQRAGLLGPLLQLAESNGETTFSNEDDTEADIDAMGIEGLISRTLENVSGSEITQEGEHT